MVMLGVVERMPGGSIRPAVVRRPGLVLAKLDVEWKLARSDTASDEFGRAVVPKKAAWPSRWKKAWFESWKATFSPS
jgi:hypothetical protein